MTYSFTTFQPDENKLADAEDVFYVFQGLHDAHDLTDEQANIVEDLETEVYDEMAEGKLWSPKDIYDATDIRFNLNA